MTLSAADDNRQPTLDVVPLGGLGEFGMNMMAVSWGDTLVLIDAGVMFPDPELLGVDLVIPDLSYLEQRAVKASAVVLTHGHEDHIGALPHVLRLVDGPIYATPLTLALVEPKLEEHGIDAAGRLEPVQPGGTVRVGELEIEFLRVTHSIPDAIALAIHTPVGTLVHTGDFKIDQTPLDGRLFDFHRFTELGAQGVLALFADSTNIERPGVTGSEADVIEPFEEVFASTRGKLIVTAFATSIYRMQILADLAQRFGRKLAFVGRGMIEHSQIAQRLGYLQLPPNLVIRDADVRSHDPARVLCVTTGSQGEPMAALSRIAVNDHRHVSVEPEDRVVFSARAIPGNEKAIDRVVNHLARRGAEVVMPGRKRLHVSGHGSEEELKLMLSLVRPRVFVPIHGEYRQRSRYARLASRVVPPSGGLTSVLLVENGDVMRFDAEGGRVVDRAPTGRVLIDGPGAGEVADEVLRDRRHLAEDGLIVPVLAIDKRTGGLEGAPEIITRGLALEPGGEAMIDEATRLVADLLRDTPPEERTDPGVVKEKIRTELRRFFRKRSNRRPLVLPVIMEI
jgi:ribonuclease J